jgi:hypothetical protein
MSDWNRPFVLDDEAYKERCAIMICESDGTMSETDICGFAAEMAYKTPFSIAATAAIRGDWEPAKALCRRQPVDYGRGLMRAIQDAVEAKRRLM